MAEPTLQTPPPTTPARLDFQPYFRLLADRMGLAHWIIEVKDEPPASESAYAMVNCWHGRAGATVRLGDGFLKETEAEQRHCAVHELVHCHLAHADRLIENDMGTAAKTAWTLAMEYGVDSLAAVIARSMPLPSEVMKAD